MDYRAFYRACRQVLESAPVLLLVSGRENSTQVSSQADTHPATPPPLSGVARPMQRIFTRECSVFIPAAIAFSVIAGVDPKVGLYASFCIAVVTALLPEGVRG